MDSASRKDVSQKSVQLASSPGNEQRLTWYTFNCALFASNGSFLCGMEAGIITTTISQPTYLDYFKPYTTDIAGAVVSALVAGGFFGQLFAGWSADSWGRRQSIKFGAFWAFIGAAIQAGSVHVGMFILGRILAGFGVGILFMTIPIYTAEIAPKNRRGLVSGLHAQFMGVGYIFTNWIGFACSYAHGQIQWRLPLAIQCVPALILVAGIYFLPGSPRWLLARGREDEALAVFKKLHSTGDGAVYHDEDLLLHFHQMREWIRHDTAEGTISQIFRARNTRKRLLFAIVVRLVPPLAGIDLVGYQAIIYNELGIKGRTVTLLIALSGVAGPAANLVALFCMDKCSRKKAMWICCLAMAGDMALIMSFTARYGGSGNKVGQGVTVAWIIVMLILSSGYNSVASVYLPEILNQATRARGSSIALCTSTLVSVLLSQISPRAFASIGYKYYSVFVCANLVGALIISTKFVETRGKSLEEISHHFGETSKAPHSTGELTELSGRVK